MTEPKSFKDGKQWAWDSTSLSSAQTCLRKYQYEMIRRIQPRRTSVHLIFGGSYASALEAFYKYRAEGMDHEAALEATVRLTLEKSWNFEDDKPVFFDDVKKTRPNLVRTVIWYIEQYGVESDDGLVTYHLEDGKPAVELSFAIELDDDIVFCGHLDRVVQLGDDLYIADQKTTGGTISNYFFKQFDTSLQMTGYAFAGKMVMKSPVRGVIIDGAQIAVKSVRHTIEGAWRAADEGYYPMNYTSCDKYGGCPFRQLCTSSKHVVENYIKSDFETRVWDPIVQR